MSSGFILVADSLLDNNDQYILCSKQDLDGNVILDLYSWDSELDIDSVVISWKSETKDIFNNLIENLVNLEKNIIYGPMLMSTLRDKPYKIYSLEVEIEDKQIYIK